MIAFPNRILFVGFGAVARCTLPILLKHCSVDPKRITIMDFEPNEAALKPWIEQGITFVKERVTPENLGSLLGGQVSAGDLLIDLAWNIDCCEIVQWCHDRGVLYVNTSVELWDPYAGANDKHPTERTLYWRHMNLRRMIARVERAGTDGRDRTRREPRPDQPFHQARSSGYRATGSGGEQIQRGSGGEDRSPRQSAGVQPPGPPARRQGRFIAASATRRSPTSPNR